MNASSLKFKTAVLMGVFSVVMLLVVGTTTYGDNGGGTLIRERRVVTKAVHKINASHIADERVKNHQPITGEKRGTAKSAGIALVMDDNGGKSDEEFEKY